MNISLGRDPSEYALFHFLNNNKIWKTFIHNVNDFVLRLLAIERAPRVESTGAN